MKITVIVHDCGDQHAVRFTEAAVHAGHQVPLVFFYQDAVQIVGLQAADNQLRAWQDLRRGLDLRLAVCIGAAARRGLIEENAAQTASKRIAEGFEVAGLGQLIGAMAESDRVITFTA